MVDATKSTRPRTPRRPAVRTAPATTPKPVTTRPVRTGPPEPTAAPVPAGPPVPTAAPVPVTKRPAPNGAGLSVPVPTIGVRRVHVRVPHLPSAALAQPRSLTARVQHGAASATRAVSALAARPLAAAIEAGVRVAGRAWSGSVGRRPQ